MRSCFVRPQAGFTPIQLAFSEVPSIGEPVVSALLKALSQSKVANLMATLVNDPMPVRTDSYHVSLFSHLGCLYLPVFIL
jgi:hypothetical protein